MQTSIIETDNGFHLELTAENMQEMATLIRMKTMSKKEGLQLSTHVYKSGFTYMNLSTEKKKNATSEVK